MDDHALESLNSGVVYLYATSTRRDFFQSLEWFLRGVFEEVHFSVVRAGRERGLFRLECSNVVEADAANRAGLYFRSRALQEVVDRGGNSELGAIGAPTLRVGSETLSISRTVVLDEVSDGLTLLVFHRPVLMDNEDRHLGLDCYTFDHIASAYGQVHERELLLERGESATARLDAIARMSSVLGTLDLEVLLSRLIDVCVDLGDAEVGSVLLVGEAPTYVEWGLPETLLGCLRFADGEEIVTRSLDTRRACLVPKYDRASGFLPVALFAIRSVLCVPIVSGTRVLGTINLVNSRNEGGTLTAQDELAVTSVAALAATAIDNAYLHRDALEKEKIEASLDVARDIQRDLLPREMPELSGYDIAWQSESCDETGGDYVDLVTLEDGALALIVGDVSGHGIGSSLLMATGRANLRALLSVRSDLREVVGRLNDLLEHDMNTANFMTLFIARLDPETNEFTYVNAGHDPPIFCRGRDGSASRLSPSGLPLGMFAEWSYELFADGPIEVGDGLLVTTDGIWEQTDRNGERFGKDRLTEVFRANLHLGADEIVAAISAEVHDFARGVSVKDDMTLLVVKRVAK